MRRGRAAGVVALLLAACTGDDGGDAGTPGVLTVTATPAEVPADEVVVIEVAGAPPGAAVEIEVTSTDDTGAAWSSTTSVPAEDRVRAEGLAPDPRGPRRRGPLTDRSRHGSAPLRCTSVLRTAPRRR